MREPRIVFEAWDQPPTTKKWRTEELILDSIASCVRDALNAYHIAVAEQTDVFRSSKEQQSASRRQGDNLWIGTELQREFQHEPTSACRVYLSRNEVHASREAARDGDIVHDNVLTRFPPHSEIDPLAARSRYSPVGGSALRVCHFPYTPLDNSPLPGHTLHISATFMIHRVLSAGAPPAAFLYVLLQ